MVVASESDDEAVIPTSVPSAAFSLTALAAALESVGLVTSNSSTSVILIVKTWSVYEASAEVARTVMFRVAPSASRSIAPATETTPVLLLIENRPPSLSNRAKVIVFVVESESEAEAVIPTVVPMEAFSATVLAAAFESVTELVSNSSTSPMLMVNV